MRMTTPRRDGLSKEARKEAGDEGLLVGLLVGSENSATLLLPIKSEVPVKLTCKYDRY